MQKGRKIYRLKAVNDICETHRQVIDAVGHPKVTNVALKRSAEDLLARLEPIAEALDSVQRDGSTIADAVAAWKKLEDKLPCLGDRTLKQKIKARYEQAISLSHKLAYVLHPQYEGRSLSDKEKRHLYMLVSDTHTWCQL